MIGQWPGGMGPLPNGTVVGQGGAIFPQGDGGFSGGGGAPTYSPTSSPTSSPSPDTGNSAVAIGNYTPPAQRQPPVYQADWGSIKDDTIGGAISQRPTSGPAGPASPASGPPAPATPGGFTGPTPPSFGGGAALPAAPTFGGPPAPRTPTSSPSSSPSSSLGSSLGSPAGGGLQMAGMGSPSNATQFQTLPGGNNLKAIMEQQAALKAAMQGPAGNAQTDPASAAASTADSAAGGPNQTIVGWSDNSPDKFGNIQGKDGYGGSGGAMNPVYGQMPSAPWDGMSPAAIAAAQANTASIPQSSAGLGDLTAQAAAAGDFANAPRTLEPSIEWANAQVGQRPGDADWNAPPPPGASPVPASAAAQAWAAQQSAPPAAAGGKPPVPAGQATPAAITRATAGTPAGAAGGMMNQAQQQQYLAAVQAAAGPTKEGRLAEIAAQNAAQQQQYLAAANPQPQTQNGGGGTSSNPALAPWAAGANPTQVGTAGGTAMNAGPGAAANIPLPGPNASVAEQQAYFAQWIAANGMPTSSSSGGNTPVTGGGGGGTPAQQATNLANSVQQQTNAANAANDDRYAQTVAGYLDRLKQTDDSLGKLTNQDKQDVDDQYIQALAKMDQDLTSRGLGNTTVRASGAQGLTESRARLLNQTADSRTREKIGYDTALQKDVLDAITGRTDQAPDQTLLALLSQLLGSGSAYQ
jgi:hypothetical protein